jgi:hypothetical protein
VLMHLVQFKTSQADSTHTGTSKIEWLCCAYRMINRLRKPLGANANAFGQTRAFWGRWGQGLGSVFLIVGVHFWRLIWPRSIGLPPFVKSRTYAKLIALKES